MNWSVQCAEYYLTEAFRAPMHMSLCNNRVEQKVMEPK